MDHLEIAASGFISKNSVPCRDSKPSHKQPVTCQVCTGANADGYCKDCHQFLCLNCFQIHTKFGTNATHKLTSLQETSATSVGEEVKQALTMNCPKHDDPLRVFCETCEELICRDCTIQTHKDHNYDLASNCYNKHYQILESTLNAVENKKNDVMIKITDLTDRESEIKEQGELVKQEIDLMAEEMIDAIRQSAKNLKGEVDSVTDIKVQVVTSQKKSADRSCGRLEECSGYVKQSLEMDTHQQVLSSKKQMMERMNGVMEEINVEDYNLIEKSDVRFIKNKKIELHHIGDVSYTTSGLLQFKVKKINSHQVTLENDSFSFPLSIESPNSSLVTVPLSSLSCSVISSTPINTTVTTTDHPGVYRIHCTPVIRGSHQVNIRVGDIQLESVSVVVPFNSYLDTITPIRTIDGFAGPFGVAISNDGHVVVAERSGNRVTVLDEQKKKIKSFSTCGGDIKFSSPRGIAITPDNFILVTDEHKIQKISMDGKLIASVGQYGTKPLEFNYPVWYYHFLYNWTNLCSRL